MTAPPDFRALGRRGGLATAARHDMRSVAANARRRAPSNLEYFYSLVDPENILDRTDRDGRARAAQRAYFTRLAERSAARRKRVTGNGQNEVTAAPDKATVTNTDSEEASSRVSPAE